ncbi:MAG: hypothetical protein P1P64_09430 [Treponemataceae bacterium]
MANEVLLTVTEEERQIARELSEYKYQLMVQGERAQARKEGLKAGRAEGLKVGRKEGHKEGLKAGRAEGLTEGLSKGEARGIQKGAYKNKLETAKLLKLLGDPMEKIVKVTGLSESEIDEL